MSLNKYHIFIERQGLSKKETSSIQFESPLSLKTILENMLTEDSIDNAENTMIKLEITNLNLNQKTNESK
jgi:hypothetical protein